MRSLPFCWKGYLCYNLLQKVPWVSHALAPHSTLPPTVHRIHPDREVNSYSSMLHRMYLYHFVKYNPATSVPVIERLIPSHNTPPTPGNHRSATLLRVNLFSSSRLLPRSICIHSTTPALGRSIPPPQSN